MDKIKYFLIVENGCQWQSAVVSCIENDKTKYPHYAYDYLVEECYDLDFSIKGKTHDSICSRELHFGNKLFNVVGHCYGWTISKVEFDTLKRMVELKPYVDEYNKLSKC